MCQVPFPMSGELLQKGLEAPLTPTLSNCSGGFSRDSLGSLSRESGLGKNGNRVVNVSDSAAKLPDLSSRGKGPDEQVLGIPGDLGEKVLGLPRDPGVHN